jgi:nitrite reductase/ring-hydroxylating ferredoxin subunit
MQEMTESREDGLKPLCKAHDVRPGTPFRANLEQVGYAVYNLNGQFFVTQARCTHGPGFLSRGSIIGDEVECPFHRGRFDIRSGRATLAPCTEALKTWAAQVIDGTIYIDPALGRQMISGGATPAFPGDETRIDEGRGE